LTGERKSFRISNAGVVEQADAPDSKSGWGNPVRVRFSPPAPITISGESRAALEKKEGKGLK
jgi:hypothetical protein